jgi:DNA helicase MCM8
VEKDEVLDLVPHHLIRKYIAYARQYVKPKISRDASKILKHYYLSLRRKHRMRDSTPITTRQLESLARLTEARAKIELRETATADDARDVLEIFESSLSSAFDDEVIAVSSMANGIIIGAPAAGKASSKKQVNHIYHIF